MTMLSKYHVPGLAIEDHSIDVPLDWTGHEPGRAFDGETIKLFYRVVTAPERVHDDLPLLIFLQGGPGGAGPRLNSPTSRRMDRGGHQALPGDPARPAGHRSFLASGHARHGPHRRRARR